MSLGVDCARCIGSSIRDREARERRRLAGEFVLPNRSAKRRRAQGKPGVLPSP
jgi:hypothetical protein